MRGKVRVIKVKYPGSQAFVYDESRVQSWIEEQYRRAKVEHPSATVTVEDKNG